MTDKKDVKKTPKKQPKIQQDPTVLNSEYNYRGGGSHDQKKK